MKANTHPEWHPDATITCNGEVIAVVGSTVKSMEVEIWSGNHPFYTGESNVIDTAGRVDRFKRLASMREKVAQNRSGKSAKKQKQAQLRSEKSENADK